MPEHDVFERRVVSARRATLPDARSGALARGFIGLLDALSLTVTAKIEIGFDFREGQGSVAPGSPQLSALAADHDAPLTIGFGLKNDSRP